MSNKKTVTWFTTLVLVAGSGATASAARNNGNGASRIEVSQGAAKVRSARLVRIRTGKSAGKLTASPVRAKVADRRAKSDRSEVIVVDIDAETARLMAAAPIVTAAITLVGAANESALLAGGGFVATVVTASLWGITKFLRYLDDRQARA